MRVSKIMLTIKLSKLGKKNKKVFRVIISEKGRDPYGNSLEILGAYDQFHKQLQVKKDRVNFWLERGAQMTPTINNLFIAQGVIEGKKVTASKAGKVSEKKQGQIKAKADKKKKAEEAAKAPVEEVAPAAEEVTEEAVA
jgi:small subunit ribosomal protein S16